MPGKEAGPTPKGRSEARVGSVPFDPDAHDHQDPKVEHPLDPFWHTSLAVKEVIHDLGFGTTPLETLEEALAKQAEATKQPA